MIKRDDGSIAVVAQDEISQRNNSLEGGSQDNGIRGTQNGDNI
jgi:hypothetical protein